VTDLKPRLSQANRTSKRLGVALCLFLATGLLSAVPASAGYEQVADFGKDELVNATGLAVNTTGAGGVPAGTFYAVNGEAGRRVLRYNPGGEFSEAWGWGVGNGKAEFQRCGPDGDPAFPTCMTTKEFSLPPGEGPGRFLNPLGVAVEQSTGRVYVLDGGRINEVVQVLSADGTELLASFGQSGAFSESVNEGPEKINPRPSGIAVSDGGVVYVSDLRFSGVFESRVLVFDDGVYTGRANDFSPSPPAPQVAPRGLATDNAGNLFFHNEEAIYEFSPADRLNSACEFQFSAGGIQSMTVNPTTGAPFFYSSKGKREIHQLSACNSEGEFVEVGTIPVTPKPEVGFEMALAFNPDLIWELGRPPGALYMADGSDTSDRKGFGHIFAPPKVFPPSVESQEVSLATSSSATLGAQINPKGFETSYVFQYLTAAEYEANEPGDRFAGAKDAPLGGGVLAAGSKPVSAASTVFGLVPDTEYRYRVVATSHCDSENEATVCEDIGSAATFRTFPVETPGLPDGRAYELVSPALKNGGEVFPLAPDTASCGVSCKPGVQSEPFPRMSSPDGEAVVYEGQPFSLTEGAVVYNQYLSKRTPTGWETTTLAPRLMGSNRQGYRAFNTELTTGVLAQGRPSLTPEAPSETSNLYVQPTATPTTLTPLLGAEPPNRGQEVKLAYAGASADFSQHFFAANDALTGPAPFAPEALDGGSSDKNLYEWVGGELRLVNVLPGNAETLPGAYFGARPVNTSGQSDNSVSDLSHAISEDGSRVFWSDEAGQVYVRENAETTTQIPDPGKFLTASADGSKVLLRNGHLYDLETEAIVDLTEGQGGFEGIVGQSEDLSRVYFVATSVLTGEEENQYGAKAEAGKFNLYAWQGGSVAFIATLLAADNQGPDAKSSDWQFSPAQRTAQASPNGRWVAFISRAPLTGYANVGPACERNSSGVLITVPCREVFLYDSATAELSCPSCNPSHAVPLGPSGLPLILQGGAGIEDPVPPVRYLTDEGRLYFDTSDSLTPSDTNGRVEDVYQYQPQGMGSCKRAGGCVSLISAGTGSVDSNFLAVDETGKNVFFTSRDQLVLRDSDDLVDLYVAREGGGIATETETARGECLGEACQPTIAAPNDPTPGSLSFQGAGNVEEKKASKKQKKKKKRAKKRGAKNHKNHNRAAKHNRGGGR